MTDPNPSTDSPLSAEEEAALRTDVDEGTYYPTWDHVRRLLATLDAARAAHPESRPDPGEGLREAAQRVVDAPESDFVPAWVRDVLRAALASPVPPDRPEPIDEERRVLDGLATAVIAMKLAIPSGRALGPEWRDFLARTGDVNQWLDANDRVKEEAARPAAARRADKSLDPAETELRKTLKRIVEQSRQAFAADGVAAAAKVWPMGPVAVFHAWADGAAALLSGPEDRAATHREPRPREQSTRRCSRGPLPTTPDSAPAHGRGDGPRGDATEPPDNAASTSASGGDPSTEGRILSMSVSLSSDKRNTPVKMVESAEGLILAAFRHPRAEALRRVEALIVKELPCNLLGCERMGTHIDEDETPLWYCEDHRSPPWAPGREFPPDPSRIAILAVIRTEPGETMTHTDYTLVDD